MSGPRHKVLDAELAGDFAKKFFGKFGFVKIEERTARTGTFLVYQVGVASPDGDFLVKGDSAFDFAEAFQWAGKYIDVKDPIYLRHTVKQLAKAEEPKPEQVELFA